MHVKYVNMVMTQQQIACVRIAFVHREVMLTAVKMHIALVPVHDLLGVPHARKAK